ncbi:MAG: CoA transferase [Acetobacteraceae bacterium]|nr:CoA transferase [Acetobacteraceae bacterium]
MDTPRPLTGITVLDLTQIYNGPYATFLLAAGGASVVKIEPPGGEHLRRRAEGGFVLPFAALNAGKRSLRLDLKTEAGRDILRRLALGADVLVENFAPGVMDRLGLGAAALQAANPRLICAASSGYGSDGPYRDYPAMDLTVQAMAGFMSITGEADGPPLKTGPAVSDFLAGVHLYGAIVTALLERERTGRARSVEVAMLEANVFPLLSAMSLLKPGDPPPARVGNRHGGLSLSPCNVYPCADGHIAIIVGNEGQWHGLLRAFGQQAVGENPRFRTVRERCARMDLVDAMVGEWTAPHPKGRVFEMLLAERVPAAPVRTLDEVAADPHMLARGALERVEHPLYGPITVPHSPLRMGGLPVEAHVPTGALGGDGRAVLAELLGLDDATLDALAAAKVI